MKALVLMSLPSRSLLKSPLFRAARFSTSSKPVTLKERLAQLIPHQIENVT